MAPVTISSTAPDSPGAPTSDKAEAGVLAELALGCYDRVYARMDRRIGQLWKARFVVWGMLLAMGAFLVTDLAEASATARAVVASVIGFVTIFMSLCHNVFENWQEGRIAYERKFVYGYIDAAHMLCRDAIDQRTELRVLDERRLPGREESQRFPDNRPFPRMIGITYGLAILLCVLAAFVALGAFSKPEPGGPSATPGRVQPAGH